MSKIEVTQSHYSDRILNRLKRALGLSAITALVLVSSTAVASDTMRVTGQQVRGTQMTLPQLNGGKFEIPHGKTGTISQASSTGNGFWISKTDSQGVYQLLEQFRPASKAEGLTLSSGKYRALPNMQRHRSQMSARVELIIELK